MVCTVSYKNSKLKIFNNIDHIAENFCKELISVINDELLEKDKVNIALSGGNTPKAVYKKLISFNDNLDWKKINLFWGDERCVPPDNDESNYKMAKDSLIDYIKIPPENIKRIMGENNPEQEAKRYSDVIKSNLSEINGLPSFDINILGLGEDGHTASIFPNQMNMLNSDNICETAYHPVTRQKRITLTGKVINNSKRIFFLVSGKNKSSVISEIINEKGDYLKYPAYHIKPLSGDMVWYLDSDAAFKIK